MDLYSYDSSLSTVNKMQREYWTAKQVLKKKFGKGEDQHVIAGDNDIDSKLSQYESIQDTCNRLLKELDKYHSCVCALARDENQLGRFLKDQGSQDHTRAGKMMIAVGKALCYSAQQRLQLRHPLSRLREDVETFRQRAIADTSLSVKKMEDERTHYRASLLWMQDISTNLDPEQYRKLEKFRKVQNEVRVNKEKFDRLKWAVCQKIDLLSASRSNLFSNTLVPYQDEIMNFWNKTARNMAAVLESFKGYQQYEFKLLKELNPIQIPGEDGSESAEKKENNDNDDALINLDESKQEDVDEDVPDNHFEDAMDALDLDGRNGNEAPTGSDLLGDFSDDTKPSEEEVDLWNDLLGGGEQESKGEFANQWKTAFGDFESAVPPSANTLDQVEKDMLDLIKPVEKDQHSSAQSKGFLPSQLLDMHFQQYVAPPMSQMPTQQPSLGGFRPPMPNPQQQTFFHQQTPMMFNQTNPTMPALYSGPFFNSQTMQRPGLSGEASGLKSTDKISKGEDGKGSKASWYNLFAELDPLQNPDALGKKEGDKTNEDGRAC